MTGTRAKFLVIVPLLSLVLFVAVPIPARRLHPAGFNSIRIYDRNGTLLREVLSYDHKTSVWVPLERVSPWVVKATLLREDRRLLLHPGVDLLALCRAARTNVGQGRIVSGGSTITMQVAKMVLGLKRRNIVSKVLEALCALKLELQLSKAQILEIYLNRVPYGFQTYGIEAGARFYLGKGCGQLSLAESCMLATLPSAPALMNPYAAMDRVAAATRQILTELCANGAIDQLTCELALNEPLNLVNRRVNFEAPHFVDHVLERLRAEDMSDVTEVMTTIDLALQQKTEGMLKTTLRSLSGYEVGQGAVLIADAASGEILAMVGSRDYFDAVEGQVNGCAARRQPGSSMKPFLYALALMSGMRLSDFLPDTIVEFRLRDGTTFAPRNYGERYHGLTRMREALASSFNVGAVYLLDLLGPERFYRLLRQFRFSSLTKGAEHYGLSLGLGAGEVTLLELVNGYRIFARQGVVSEMAYVRGFKDRDGRTRGSRAATQERVLPTEISYLVTDVLADDAARFKAFGVDNPLRLPFACAAKTGTSKDYRDNWCIGYSRDYVVGVWVGNFSGAPMRGVSGISGAAPLFHDIMIELHRDGFPQAFAAPGGLVRRRICSRTGLLAGPECDNQLEEIFIARNEPTDSCGCGARDNRQPRHYAAGHGDRSNGQTSDGLTIAHPADGDVFKIDPHVSAGSQRIKFSIRAADPVETVRVMLDGAVVAVVEPPFEFLWSPVRGEHVLDAVVEREGIVARDRVAFAVY